MNENVEQRESYKQYAQHESALELVYRSSLGVHLYVIAAIFVIFSTGILFDAPLLSGCTAILLGVVSLRRSQLAVNFKSAYAHSGESAFRQFVILQCFQAAVWGLFASIIIGQYGMLSPQSTLTLLVTMGFMAGGTHSLTARRYVHILFLSCMTLPILPDFFSITGVESFNMTGTENLSLLTALFLFLYLLVIEGDKSNRSFLRQLQNQYQLIIEQQRAKEANEAKGQFLANMSHEFRTPMNSVVTLTDLLMNDSLTSKQRQYTETIQSSAAALLQLINDILDFSKIEAEQIEIDLVEFSPRKLFDEVTELVARDVTERGLDYVCFVDTGVPQSLWGDPWRLRQVVINLVSNAIKFTDHGEVTTRVCMGDTNEFGSELKVSVTDTGIGIRKDKLKDLFTAFDQADASVTRRHGGSGLGLSISKNLVQMMGGSIEVDSEFGTGSTFTFTISLPKTTASTVDQTPPLLSSTDRTRVLVSESNATTRAWLYIMLEAGGCHPATEENPQAGMDSIVARLISAAEKGDPFQLAMVDAELIDHQFGQLTERIRAQPLIREVALIFIVRCGEGHDTRQGRYNSISKPITEASLRRCFVEERLVDTQAVEPIPKIIDWKKQAGRKLRHNRILVAEDNLANQRVASAILEQAGYEADVVSDGNLAIKALESKPYDLVLMDCSMPNLDGFSATRAIRKPDSGVINPNIPIIAVTALAMKGDEQKCIDAGMDDYVCKPINTASLIQKIERCLDPVNREQCDITTTDPGMNDTKLETNVMEVDELRELKLLESIIELFLEDAPNQVDELQRAIQSMDCEKLQAINHKIRGTSSLLGADLISNLTIAAEGAAREGDYEQAVVHSEKVVAELQKLMAQMAEPEDEKIYMN